MSHTRLVRATYRAFLREARALEKSAEAAGTSAKVALLWPIPIAQYGHGAYVPTQPHPGQLQRLLFEGVDFAGVGLDEATTFTAADVKRLVRHAYRSSAQSAAE
jgi:hypothetical protein